MQQNALLELRGHGQSIWLDYIRRSLVKSGALKRLVDEDGLRGVTSNPSIFEKAIDGSTDYDEALDRLLTENPHRDARALYDVLSIDDVRNAADVLRRAYEDSGGVDGFVSLEPPPQVTQDTSGTIAEARRLWRAVDRPNLMIKVVATPEGIAAVEELIAEGINVNITLMFSLRHYEAVANAYIQGLERCQEPAKMASVASFFVSRVDTQVDRALEAIGSEDALALRGKVAIANAKMAYRRFREIFYGERFEALRRRGARVQRPLWASTSTKNPKYRDVMYVEELVGPDTVNTIPPTTLDAFRDHGQVRGSTVMQDMDQAESSLAKLGKLGIDLNAITEKLQVDGIAAFASAYDRVVAALEKKRRGILIGSVDRQVLEVGQWQPSISTRLQSWADFPHRLWAKDPTLWGPHSAADIVDRLGWLNLPELMQEQVWHVAAFANSVRADGIRYAVLLGMGGSSLAPKVFARTFGSVPGYPELIVLDSTHPTAIKSVENRIDLPDTLFVVSSKSGTTLETLSLFRYFWHKMGQTGREPGSRFIAITDPNTPLEKLAIERGFCCSFTAPSDVGGRYSALSVFGLVPAGLIGTNIQGLLDRAWRLAEACAFCVPTAEDPAVTLGAALGELARAGRDKLTFIAPPLVAALPVWIEQLVAESTGKEGEGIVPIVDEMVGGPDVYGSDRVFVHFGLPTERDGLTAKLGDLRSAGHPIVSINLTDLLDIGEEFFRWEIAVAAAGAIIGVNPFDQPDVELAKELARKAMQAPRTTSAASDTVPSANTTVLDNALDRWFASASAGDYIAIQAYLAPTPKSGDALQQIRLMLRDQLRLATTVGYGPRFLHSTGQLHKGGPNGGLFLQLVDDPEPDVAVPETQYTFGTLIRAQAEGDYQALKQRGRRVVRIHLGSDALAGLEQLRSALGKTRVRRSGT